MAFTQVDVKSKKIISEIQKDLQHQQPVLQSIQTLTSSLPTLIKEYGIQTYDAEEYSLEEVIRKVVSSHSLVNGVILFDIGALFKRYFLWKIHLPGVMPYYAVKSCPDPVVIHYLNDLGVRFDVASQGEINLLNDLGIPGEKMIYANPVKHETHLSNAKSVGVQYTTFDSRYELKKISHVFPRAKLLLRICVDDSESLIPFSSKFGCPSNNYERVFKLAKELDLQIVGVSFHVGSGCKSPKAHSKAIEEAKKVFDLAQKYDYSLKILDIGGGFPGREEENEQFIAMCETISTSIQENFANVEIEVWAEPGRFFSTSCATLITSIIGKNEYLKEEEVEKCLSYTCNCSIYSALSCIIFDKTVLQLRLLSGVHGSDKYKSKIFGHSCDSLDVILPEEELPEMDYGDILYFLNMGAYTMASSSNFNGFSEPTKVYVYIY